LHSTAAAAVAAAADRACLELAKLPELRQLNLSQNRHVGDVGLRALAGGRLAASLEVLNLSYTSVTDASVPALAGLKVRGLAIVCHKDMWCMQNCMI
jgi:hypothetical protein